MPPIGKRVQNWPVRTSFKFFHVIRPNLTPCNESNMIALKKCETGKKCMDCFLFPDINHLMMLACLIFKKILWKIKSLLLFLANGIAC